MRTHIVGSAVLLAKDRCIGTFSLENLSAGGASLRGAIGLAVGEEVRVLLQLPGSSRRLAVVAIVVRRVEVDDGVRYAIRFVRVAAEVQLAIERAIVQEPRSAPPTRVVLVIDPLPVTAMRLAQDLESLGREPVTVLTALDALTWLTPKDVAVDAVIVDADLERVDGLSMLEFVAADYPGVRRVLTCEDCGKFRPALASGGVHALLPKPWVRETLSDAVRDGGRPVMADSH